MIRKFGTPEQICKILMPKVYLRVCDVCGNNCESGNGTLCPHCYAKNRTETELIQKKIQQELKLSPVDSEVVVLYKGERDEKSAETWNGKRIVEIKKKRPNWFSKNLLEKTTQPLATTKEVKPDELG